MGEHKKTKAKGKKPRIVRVRIRMSNLLEVNPVQGYAKLDCSVRASWSLTEKEINQAKEQMKDHFQPPQNFSEQEWRDLGLWNPELIIHNAVEGQTTITYFVNSKEGEIEVVRKLAFVGSISNFMNLHHFPFDSDWLMIHGLNLFVFLIGLVRSEPYDVDKLQLEWDVAEEQSKGRPEDYFEVSDVVGNATATGLVEWTIGQAEAKVSTVERNSKSPKPGQNARDVSSMELKIPIKRNFSFFLYRVLLVLLIIYAISWVTFLMDPNDFSDRMEVNLSLLLSIVALLFAITDYLPKLPYLTFLDKTILLTFVLMFLTVVENAVVFKIQDKELADIIDYASLALFPIILLCAVIGFALPVYKFTRKQQNQFKHEKQNDMFQGRKFTPRN